MSSLAPRGSQSAQTQRRLSTAQSRGLLYERRSLAPTDKKGILNREDQQSSTIRITHKSEHKSLHYQQRILQNARFVDPDTKMTVDPQTLLIKKIMRQPDEFKHLGGLTEK